MKDFPQLVIAGWTGRNEVALQKHIRELEKIGLAFRALAAGLVFPAAALCGPKREESSC